VRERNQTLLSLSAPHTEPARLSARHTVATSSSRERERERGRRRVHLVNWKGEQAAERKIGLV
jgi:hypothetical protein